MRDYNHSDPFDLLGKKVPSEHCLGKEAEIVMYDHFWFQKARCDCGEYYVHDKGVAEPFFLNVTKEEILESIKRVKETKRKIEELELKKRK